MITDDERRKIARKLRAAAVYLPDDIDSDDLEMAIATTVCNYDVPNVERLLNRLADLIEPSCDRDALLALADDMDMVRNRCDFCNKESDCDWADETVCLESYMDDYASCIRESLGVES